MKPLTILVVMMILIHNKSVGQQNKLKPFTEWKNCPTEIRNKEINSYKFQGFRKDSLREADKLSGGKRNRLSVPINIQLNTVENGTNDIWDNKIRIWRVVLSAKDASKIAVRLTNISLSNLAEVYFYNPKRTIIYGPLNNKRKIKEEEYSCPSIEGDSIIVELFEPYNMTCQPSSFKIETIHYFYKSTSASDDEWLDCYNDVSCYPQLSQISNSVVRLEIMNTSFEYDGGSGVLLNNSCQNGKLYVMTNLHVIETEPDESGDCFISMSEEVRLQSAKIHFNFKKNSCNNHNEIAIDEQILEGLNVLTYCPRYDAALVEISGDLQSGFELPDDLYFAGWETTTNSIGDYIAIGHPIGFSQKVAIDFDNENLGIIDVPPKCNSNDEINKIFFQWDGNVNGHYGFMGHGASGCPIFDNQIPNGFTPKMFALYNSTTYEYVCPTPGTEFDYGLRLFDLRNDYACDIFQNYLDPSNTNLTLEGMTYADIIALNNNCPTNNNGTEGANFEIPDDIPWIQTHLNRCNEESYIHVGCYGEHYCTPSCTFFPGDGTREYGENIGFHSNSPEFGFGDNNGNGFSNIAVLIGVHWIAATGNLTISIPDNGNDETWILGEETTVRLSPGLNSAFIVDGLNGNLNVIDVGDFFVTCCEECSQSGPMYKEEIPRVDYNKFQNSNLIDNQYYIFPNPTLGVFYIKELIEGYLKKYSVINTLGQVLISSNFEVGLEKRIDISSLYKGVYILQLETNDGFKAERIIHQ